jgi:malate/lactate dehydrogenase
MKPDQFPVVERMLARAISWRLAMPEVSNDIELLIHALHDNAADVVSLRAELAAARAACPCARVVSAETDRDLLHDAVGFAGQSVMRRDLEIERLKAETKIPRRR